jgi:Holliday junction resolvase RusA-like endonuclease
VKVPNNSLKMIGGEVMLNTENDNFKIESKGYEQGINPLMGEFKRKFDIKPIPYGNKNKSIFFNEVRELLKDVKYYFWGEIKLNIRIYLNESRRYETPESGDLDNYAKLICDSLSGTDGIIIDDSQIQTLIVQWIDTTKQEHFEVDIFSHPDEFIIKDVEFYEMQNGLYYPFSKKYWSLEGVKENNDLFPLLQLFYDLTKIQKPLKHTFRQMGLNKEDAYYQAQKVHPVLRGFHFNRISQFKIHKLKEWKEY